MYKVLDKDTIKIEKYTIYTWLNVDIPQKTEANL